ncbi:MAG: hypothetical protein ACP5FX_00525 [Candidatus Micrarchaeia archaeon]
MLWFLILFLTFLLGFLFSKINNLWSFSSFSLGILFTSWIFFISLFFNIGFYFAFFVLLSLNIFLLYLYYKQNKTNRANKIKTEKNKEKEEVQKSFFGKILFLITLAILIFWFVSSLFYDREGNLIAYDGFYSDLPWHLGIQNFFANSKKIKLIFPYFYNTSLYYPFLPDFYIGMLIRSGINGVDINIILNPILAFFLVFSFYSFVKILTKDELKAGLSTFLFFFATAGVVSILTNFIGLDYCGVPRIQLNSIMDFFFSGDRKVYNFDDVIRDIFTPQRGYLIAFPIDLLLISMLFKRKNPKIYFFILSLLPFFHSHSFIAISVFSLLWLKEKKNIKYFFILLLAIPQVVYILLQPKSNFFYFINEQFYCGITKNPILSRLIFWVRAFGPIFIFGIFGSIVAFKKQKSIFELFIPAFLLFLVVNVISLQPSFGDNNKLTIFFLAFLAIFSTFLTKNKIAILAIILLACEDSFFYIWFQANSFFSSFNPLYTSTPLFSKIDFKVAELILNKTQSNSVILSLPAELNGFESLFNPVAALTGRPSISTMDGYLGCIGIPYEKVAKVSTDALRIYSTWNCSLIKNYNISYVFIGPKERELIKNYPNFEKIFNISYKNQTYLFYKVNCSVVT